MKKILIRKSGEILEKKLLKIVHLLKTFPYILYISLLKKKVIKSNDVLYVTKFLRKAIMKRSILQKVHFFSKKDV